MPETIVKLLNKEQLYNCFDVILIIVEILGSQKSCLKIIHLKVFFFLLTSKFSKYCQESSIITIFPG